MSTLAEVASTAGVSTATVSRVFSRPEAVSESTRDRVVRAAEQLDFAPNAAARSLATGRTGNIGMLIPDITNPGLASAVTSAQQHARENGFALFVAAGTGSAEDESDLVRAIARQVDGLILTAPRMSNDELHAATRIAPAVLINRLLGELPAVLMPAADGMAQAVNHLADLGHSSIAYLAGPEHALAERSRREGVAGACRQRGVRTHVVRSQEAGSYVEAGDSATEHVLAPNVTAAVAFNDQTAVGLMRGLVRHGLHTGTDFSVIGVDDSLLAESTDPPLTTIHLPFPVAGRTATQLLIDHLAGKTLGDSAIVELSTRLVVRSSTASPA